MSFETAFQKVIMAEGGYSNHASDTGGETQFGITKAVARANGYQGDMRALPLATAKQIYKRQYWDTLRLDEVSAVSPAVAHEMFDTGVNQGIAVAGQYLQIALSALNRQATDFPDIAVDGVVGPVTLSALRAYANKRGADGEVVLLKALNILQGARYLEIAANNKTQESFVYGWLRTRVSL